MPAPRETLLPLARKLRKRIIAPFDDKQPRDLARRLRTDTRFAGKTIVVAWRHGTLPALARALRARRVPVTWPEARYDWL